MTQSESGYHAGTPGASEATATSPMTGLRLPNGCSIRKKEFYEYVSPTNTYDVELFENHDGTYYAIGIPREGQRLVVYGTNIVQDATMALQILVDKIRRENLEATPYDSDDEQDDREYAGDGENEREDEEDENQDQV